MPVAIALTLVPVVTFQAPAALLIPSDTGNGTRLDTLVAPPVKILMALPAPSLTLTAPGEVVAGTIQIVQASRGCAGRPEHLVGLRRRHGFIVADVDVRHEADEAERSRSGTALVPDTHADRRAGAVYDRLGRESASHKRYPQSMTTGMFSVLYPTTNISA